MLVKPFWVSMSGCIPLNRIWIATWITVIYCIMHRFRWTYITNWSINHFLHPRLIQEEKFNTEQRAEELEHRVGTGSVDNFDIFTPMGGKSGRPHHSYWDTQPRNLTRSLPGSMVMPLDLDRVSPPHSGSSTPVSSRRSTPADILGSQYSYSQPQISNMGYLGGGSDTETGAISSKVRINGVWISNIVVHLEIRICFLGHGSYKEDFGKIKIGCNIYALVFLSGRSINVCSCTVMSSVFVTFLFLSYYKWYEIRGISWLLPHFTTLLRTKNINCYSLCNLR